MNYCYKCGYPLGIMAGYAMEVKCRDCGYMNSDTEGELRKKIAEMKDEIEQLKKRQLPEGWHVARLRNTAVQLIESTDYGYRSYAVGVDLNGYTYPKARRLHDRDVMEIDGIKTEAGE